MAERKRPAGATGVQSGGDRTLNLTAAAVIKARPGVVGVLTVITTVTGTISIHDTTTTGAAAAANAIYTSAANPAAGTVIKLDFPCRLGIVFSGTISAGVCALSWE
jgi:hypothetical protein